jgi:RND family efflux transporter MFP subunit
MPTASATSSRAWLVRSLLVGVPLAVVLYVYFIALRPVAVVAPAVRGRAVHAVPGSVEVTAEYVMELKSEVGGRIIASSLAPGLPVQKGEVLVQLDTGDVDLEIERTKNEITAARRRVELGSPARHEELNKRDTLENLERQTKLGAYPQAEFEKEKRLYQQLVQRRELDEVNLRLALENFENSLRAQQREKAKMTIVSPLDGVVSEVSLAARVGDLIGRDVKIATLISATRAVEAKISEENFAGIKVGQKASVRFLGYGSQLYSASVTKVLPTANPETQRYTIHLAVDLPAEKLVPGLTGEASIVIGERDGQSIIPRRALRGNEVFVIEAGRVVTRKVQVGYLGLNEAEILNGLREGEQVIVEDLDQFQPGDRVRTKELK